MTRLQTSLERHTPLNGDRDNRLKRKRARCPELAILTQQSIT